MIARNGAFTAGGRMVSTRCKMFPGKQLAKALTYKANLAV
jgi:hypothetical protein